MRTKSAWITPGITSIGLCQEYFNMSCILMVVSKKLDTIDNTCMYLVMSKRTLGQYSNGDGLQHKLTAMQVKNLTISLANMKSIILNHIDIYEYQFARKHSLTKQFPVRKSTASKCLSKYRHTDHIRTYLNGMICLTHCGPDITWANVD